VPEPGVSVVLAAEADGRIGFGHAARCVSLYRELVSRGVPVEFRVRASEEAAAWIAAQNVEACRMPTRAALLTPLDFAPGRTRIVVTDLLHTSRRTIRAWREAGADRVVHINDSGSFAVGADAYVDVDATRLDIRTPPDAPTASGFEFAIVSDVVQRARPGEAANPGAGLSVIVTCGGADLGRVTEAVVDALEPWHGGALTVMCGAGWDPARRDAMHQRAREGRTVLDAVASLVPVMLEHHVVVTIGGATALEANCLGLSVVLVQWAHLARHARRAARLGLAQATAASDLREVLADRGALWRCAKAGYHAVDGRGTERIVDFLSHQLPHTGHVL
jgi:spore coat polysaccharide biosynthesis predicted glycosyltransferase SpsG